MTIFYDNRHYDTLSFNENSKSDEEPNQIPEEVPPEANVCRHCMQIIVDRYYYKVDGVSWHRCCLRCYACQVNLTNLKSCFSKNQKIWCKQDYNRQFRCQKCLELLRPSDLIMRSGPNGLPYHVDCFRCCTCNVLLQSGDSYGYSNGRLFCKKDFLTMDPSGFTDGRKYYTCNDIDIPISDVTRTPLTALHRLTIEQLSTENGEKKISINDITGNLKEADSPCDSASEKQYTTLETCLMRRGHHNEEEVTGLGHQEKSILNIELKLEKVSSPLSTYEQDGKHIDDTGCSADVSSETDLGKDTMDRNSTMEASTVCTDDENASGPSCSGDSDSKMTVSGSKNALAKKGSSSLRQKRVRTSFKHQQLRTMKAYFTINHNPDSKDLRQLSQKTGLSKRVLQVWFQNARAKFRRSLCRQASIMCPASSNQMPMPNVFDESMLTIDKNGNFTSQAKMNTFADMSSSSILNHSTSNNQRLCNISDIGFSNLANMRDRYLPNEKQFIATNNYYNIPSQNSPSLFSMEVGNLAANLGLVDFVPDHVDSFHQRAELGMGQKL